MLKRKARTLPYTKQFWALSVQGQAVCWHFGNLFSWWQQKTYFLTVGWSWWTAKLTPSWVLAPFSSGMQRRQKVGEEIVGGGNDSLIRKAKAVCPRRAAKGTDSLLPIGRQVSSDFRLSMPGGGSGVKDKWRSHKCLPFLLLPPTFIIKYHIRW